MTYMHPDSLGQEANGPFTGGKLTPQRDISQSEQWEPPEPRGPLSAESSKGCQVAARRKSGGDHIL